MAKKPVLILGPTGAGKTEIAWLIHDTSDRKNMPFRHEQASDNKGSDMRIAKGRWVGFGKNSGIAGIPKDGVSGILQSCAGGTVFVDEIADLPLEFQIFLLTVLDRRPIPLTAGIGQAIIPEVRLIGATNQYPAEAVSAGILREDLYRRLWSQEIRIPPLAERKSDIFLFVEALCGRHRPDPSFLLALINYAWPGNVGELRDVLEASLCRAGKKSKTLTLDDLELRDASILTSIRKMDEKQVERALYRELENALLDQGLEKGRGLQKRAAELLRVSQSTMSRRMREIGQETDASSSSPL